MENKSPFFELAGIVQNQGRIRKLEKDETFENGRRSPQNDSFRERGWGTFGLLPEY